MAKGFDLGALLSDVPNINTERKQIEYISLDDIISDPNNHYQLTGIEELAANIEMVGLQQPLEVRPSKTHPGMFTVTSGHRRKAALEMLGEDEVPCIVVEPMGSDALQELRLIFANSDTRQMTPGELAWQASRVKELFYQLKEEGHEFPGRMRDHVAAVLKMSKSKLGRLEAIQNNLKPENLRKAFEAGQINEATAYEISKRSEAVQKIADTMSEEFCVITTDEATRILDGMEEDAAKPVPVPKINTEPVAPTYDARKEANKYLEQRRSEDTDYFSLMECALTNFVSRMSVSDNRRDNIDNLKRSLRNGGGTYSDFSYGGSGGGLDLACFKRAIPNIRRSWTEAYDFLCAAALMRLKKELTKPVPKINTNAQWQSGVPERSGKYYCKVELEGGTMINTLIYNDGWKLLSGGHPLDEACTVLGWWPLPEE